MLKIRQLREIIFCKGMPTQPRPEDSLKSWWQLYGTDLREQIWKDALLDLLLVNRVGLVREVEIGHPWVTILKANLPKSCQNQHWLSCEPLGQIAYLISALVREDLLLCFLLKLELHFLVYKPLNRRLICPSFLQYWWESCTGRAESYHGGVLWWDRKSVV